MTVDSAAKVIWDFMQLGDVIRPADAIFILGSSDIRVADRAAELQAQNYAATIIISGGVGTFNGNTFNRPEAQVFAERLETLGVDKKSLILEDEATNTSENLRFTFELLRSMGKEYKSFILVQKPYMERRAFAAFKKQWPDHRAEIMVTSPRITYDDYFTESLPKDFVINVMVGDLQRIREYPKFGFQIEQEIPQNVWSAYEFLVSRGYTKHLI